MSAIERNKARIVGTGSNTMVLAHGFAQTDIDALHEAMASNDHAWASGFAPIAAANNDAIRAFFG